MTVQISDAVPVNELGEIVLTQGQGSTNVVATIPSDTCAIDLLTGKVPVVGLSSGAQAFNSLTTYTAGQQVVYAGGLYQFTSAHPAGNWTGNDVVYLRQDYGVLNTIGSYRPAGIQSSWTPGALATSNVSTPSSTRTIKWQVDAPFNRAKITFHQREPSPARGWAVAFAPTEVEAVDTVANATDPIVNATNYNVLADSSNPYGWRIATWGGSALKSRVMMPAFTTYPGQGYFTLQDSASCDWTPCVSVPNASGNLPLLLIRVNRIANIGDAIPNLSTSNGFATAWSNYATDKVFNRLRCAMLSSTTDGITSPASHTGGAVFDPTVAANHVWYNATLHVDHGRPTRVFALIGDSITEGYNCFSRAIMQLSTAAAPATFLNYGTSTNRPEQYLAELRQLLREENYVTDVVLPSFSPNLPSTFVMKDAIKFWADLKFHIDLCLKAGKRVYPWTSYAALTSKFSGTPAAVTAINWLNAQVRAYAGVGGYAVIEVANGWDNSTMNGDGTHPNTLGRDFVNGRALPVFQGA